MGERINSAAKGRAAERDVVTYLKAQGWPDARRSVATGFSNGVTESQDVGDILGVPGFCLQVKNMARRLEGKLLLDVWQETQRQAAELTRLSGVYATPVIVEKRAGQAFVSRWWLHMASRSYVRMLTGRWQLVTALHLVRVEVGDVIGDLRAWSGEIERDE